MTIFKWIVWIEISSENLIKAYKMIEEGTYEKPNNYYCSQHTIKSFQDVVEGCVS